jgi:hypothetical protein
MLRMGGYRQVGRVMGKTPVSVFRIPLFGICYTRGQGERASTARRFLRDRGQQIMATNSHTSVVPYKPDFTMTKVDLWRFSKYLRIANVVTHLLIPYELIIDRPKKHLFSLLKIGYPPHSAIRYLVWYVACVLYSRALMDKSFFLADHKHLDICDDTKKIIELLGYPLKAGHRYTTMVSGL